MSPARALVSTFALLSLVSACEHEGRTDAPVAQVGAPASLEDALLFVGETAPEEPQVVIVDVSHKQPALTRHALPESLAVRLLQRPGSGDREALVLASGRQARLEDGERHEAVQAELWLVDRNGPKARYALPGQFDALTPSDDGRYAIAHEPLASEFTAANTMAVIDLQRAPDVAGAVRNLPAAFASGALPTSFAFSPATDARRLALALMQDNVIVFALESPEQPEYVPLALPSDSGPLRPDKVLFAGDQVYLRSTGSTRVTALQLHDDAAQARGFSVTRLHVETGSPVRDIALRGAGEAERLVVLSSDGVTEFDRRGVETTFTPLEGTFDALLAFEDRAPTAGQSSARLLAYGQSDTRVAFVELELGQGVILQSPEYMELTEPVQSVVSVAALNLAAALHASGRISLINLAARTVAPVWVGDQPRSTWFDAAHARLWVTTLQGTVGSTDLNTFSGERLLLDAAAEGVLPIPGKTLRVAVIHESDSGHVTLLDAASPARETGSELQGFLWSGLFD